MIRRDAVHVSLFLAVGTLALMASGCALPGAVDNTGNTMMLYAGAHEADGSVRPHDARVRWPRLTDGELGYSLPPGGAAQVMIEVAPTDRSGGASVDRLKLSYELDGRRYEELSNVVYSFSADDSGDCPPQH